MKTSDQLLRPADGAAFLGVSTTTFWRMSKNPDFPLKVQIGRRAVGYWRSELEDYLAGRQVPRSEVA